MRLRHQAPHELVVELDRLAQDAQRRFVLGRVLEVLQQEELTQVPQQVADELRVVDALIGETLDELQDGGRLPLDAEVGDLEEQVAAR